MIDLPAQHLTLVRTVLESLAPGVSAFAFGSRVEGRAKKHSDLDLALHADGPLDWRLLARLREAFEESDLPIRVEVLDWAACSVQFKNTVGPKAVPLFPAQVLK